MAGDGYINGTSKGLSASQAMQLLDRVHNLPTELRAVITEVNRDNLELQKQMLAELKSINGKVIHTALAQKHIPIKTAGIVWLCTTGVLLLVIVLGSIFFTRIFPSYSPSQGFTFHENLRDNRKLRQEVPDKPRANRGNHPLREFGESMGNPLRT